MANRKDIFIKWLNEKLRELNTDEAVFGAYILSILESEEDETEDEKLKALNDIINEIITNKDDDYKMEITNTIIEKWKESCKDQNLNGLNESKKDSVPIDIELVKLIEQTQKLKPISRQIKSPEYTEEERRIKEQILIQYSKVEVSDDEDDVGAPGVSSGDLSHDPNSGQDSSDKQSSYKIPPNTNVQTVLLRQKAKREEARQEAAAKKQKDKEDRERQKQSIEEKKEKRKTVKGERRR